MVRGVNQKSTPPFQLFKRCGWATSSCSDSLPLSTCRRVRAGSPKVWQAPDHIFLALATQSSQPLLRNGACLQVLLFSKIFSSSDCATKKIPASSSHFLAPSGPAHPLSRAGGQDGSKAWRLRSARFLPIRCEGPIRDAGQGAGGQSRDWPSDLKIPGISRDLWLFMRMKYAIHIYICIS